MNLESPYFYIENQFELNKLDQILDLAICKTYGSQPGILYNPKNDLSPITNFKIFETSGLFRGQSKNWPLIPSAYRDIDIHNKKNANEFTFFMNYEKANYQMKTFCALAIKQNIDFPNNIYQQMIIAQHYGIKTPLLDWTKNILVAIYFAFDFKNSEKDKRTLQPYIYKVKDERLFGNENEIEDDFEKQKKSIYLKPFPFDRRIERQFSEFSFHPFPQNGLIRIPVDEYKISVRLYRDLTLIMKGQGLNSSHYFPDYAGLAERIKQGYSL